VPTPPPPLQAAAKAGADVAVILGEDELASGTVTVKVMRHDAGQKGTQTAAVGMPDLIAQLCAQRDACTARQSAARLS
jgi:histidyl-tRNA synthetase